MRLHPAFTQLQRRGYCRFYPGCWQVLSCACECPFPQRQETWEYADSVSKQLCLHASKPAPLETPLGFVVTPGHLLVSVCLLLVFSECKHQCANLITIKDKLVYQTSVQPESFPVAGTSQILEELTDVEGSHSHLPLKWLSVSTTCFLPGGFVTNVCLGISTATQSDIWGVLTWLPS